MARKVAALAAGRQPGRIGGRGARQIGCPGARRLIEPQGSGGVRHIGAELPVQAVADPVFGREDAGNAGMGRRLVPRQPQQFRRAEPGMGRHPCDAPDIRMGAGQGGGLGMGAPVVPQHHRADHGCVRVQQHRPVHLAREANGAHLCPVGSAARRQRGAGGNDSAPPVLGVLLAGIVVRACDLQRNRFRAQGAQGRIAQKHLDRRGADVDAQIHAAPRCRPGSHAMPGAGGVSIGLWWGVSSWNATEAPAAQSPIRSSAASSAGQSSSCSRTGRARTPGRKAAGRRTASFSVVTSCAFSACACRASRVRRAGAKG